MSRRRAAVKVTALVLHATRGWSSRPRWNSAEAWAARAARPINGTRAARAAATGFRVARALGSGARRMYGSNTLRGIGLAAAIGGGYVASRYYGSKLGKHLGDRISNRMFGKQKGYGGYTGRRGGSQRGHSFRGNQYVKLGSISSRVRAGRRR